MCKSECVSLITVPRSSVLQLSSMPWPTGGCNNPIVVVRFQSLMVLRSTVVGYAYHLAQQVRQRIEVTHGSAREPGMHACLHNGDMLQL